VDASLGQAIFNDTLPKGYPFVREQADKGKLSQIVNKLAEEYPKVEVAASLDRIKDAGFYWATRSGVTVALSDVLTPPNKGEIIAKYEKQAQKVQGQFEKGLVTDAERRQEQIKIWTEATDEVQAAMKANFPPTTPSTAWCPRAPVVTGCRSATSPASEAWSTTPRVRSCPARSSPRTARGCRSRSTSPRRTVPVRVWPTRPSVPPTRVT
jgi:hypothetical protein